MTPPPSPPSPVDGGWTFLDALFGLQPWQWACLIGAPVVAGLLGWLFQGLLLGGAQRIAKLTDTKWDDEIVAAARGPLRLLLAGTFLAALSRLLLLPPRVQGALNILVHSLVILSFTWIMFRTLRLGARFLVSRVQEETQDAAKVRGFQTQVEVLRRVFEGAIFVVAAALLLMQFELVRNVGVSLLASAGIAGIVIGLAAQRSIQALLAGIQLTLTQPIRIGDSVVVEGEFGTIEEINLTYVVVKVWDLRRLVIPMSYFLDKPFQNWSKGGNELLGVVNLQLDWAADVEAIRAEVKRLLAGEAAPLWDGKTSGVHVTDVTEKTATVRVLISAVDAGKLFDLRALLRERLISFIGKHPTWLPVVRSDAKPLEPRPETPSPPR